MKANVSMGVHCPYCDITIGTYASIGGDNNCPRCGREMQPAPQEKKTRVIANFRCECGFSAGLFSSVGDDAKCPQCGRKI